MMGNGRGFWSASLSVLLLSAVPFWVLSACSENGSADAEGGAGPEAGGLSGSGASSPGTGGQIPDGAPTWAADLAPLIYSECVGCHRDGGVGPFPLETYQQAAEVSSILAALVEERHMPPMPVDGSGQCNTYSNARWLSEDEIGLFTAWDEAGAPMGDLSIAPELPAPPPALENPDLTLDPGESYLPNVDLVDDYRCFIVDPALTAPSFVVAYEVEPGDERVVHHAIVYEPDSDEAALEAVALDEAEAGPGYTCFGGVGVASEPRVLWAPGGGFVELPKDTGVPLAAGRKLVLQVHYNVSNGSFPDQTKVKLALSDTVKFPARYQAIGDLDMRLEPGLSEATTTRTFPVLGQAITVHGVMPHMHTLGRELLVTAEADGAEQCLVLVDRWDFHSQNAWWYSEARVFDSVQSVSISCTYDTTSRSEVVTWGEGTDDEMCLTYLYVTDPE